MADLNDSSIFVCCITLLLGLHLLQPEELLTLQLIQLTLVIHKQCGNKQAVQTACCA